MKVWELFESGNTWAKTIEWKQATHGGFEAIFTDEHSDTYEIKIFKFNLPSREELSSIDGLKIYNIQFGIVNEEGTSAKTTNKGRGHTIFSIVENEILKKVKSVNLDPDVFIFSVSKDPAQNIPKEVEGRKRLYYKIALKIKDELKLPFVYTNVDDRKYSNTFLCKNEPNKEQSVALKFILKNKI